MSDIATYDVKVTETQNIKVKTVTEEETYDVALETADTIEVSVAEQDETYSVLLTNEYDYDVEMSSTITLINGDTYYGEYTFTPTTSTQIAQTSGKTLSSNITINPIPSNYGLITYNGSTITVS